MVEMAALRVAVDLLHVPSRIRALRAKPLPEGVPVVLMIAAGDQDVTRKAAAIMERSHDDLRAAAVFFIEQILLFSDTDSYRVLGARSHATSPDLRRNMALLLRWLHPDMDPPDNRSVLAAKVNKAWDNLKTLDRRATYDQAYSPSTTEEAQRSGRKRRAGSARRVARPHDPRHVGAPRLVRTKELGPGGLFKRLLFFFRPRET